IDTSLAALNNEILAEQSAEVGLQEEIEAEKKRALALNAMGLEYSKLTRNLGTTKKMYESLLKRQTEADLSGRLDSNFVRWFERPEPILSPIRPSLTKNTAVGILAGLLLGMLIVIGGVLLDNTVHRQADIEQLLGLPFLGVFPKILETQATKAKVRDRGYSRDRDLYVSQNPKSVVAECARSVRTNLMFMATDRPMNRLLFTSARPSEGKTTTAISVGVSMAQAGNRVLLLDTDLRKPRLHRAFGVSGEEGLTSVLVGESLQNVIKQTDVADLFVLPCGPTPPNPAELLHTEKFAKVLDELSELYDRVILDSPPVGAVTDASILSRLVDATILVVQAHIAQLSAGASDGLFRRLMG
ncbi:MAG: polysaccharide biosynthesis tyrosine autokinase, partial [Myxococcota bacterium]